MMANVSPSRRRDNATLDGNFRARPGSPALWVTRVRALSYSSSGGGSSGRVFGSVLVEVRAAHFARQASSLLLFAPYSPPLSARPLTCFRPPDVPPTIAALE